MCILFACINVLQFIRSEVLAKNIFHYTLMIKVVCIHPCLLRFWIRCTKLLLFYYTSFLETNSRGLCSAAPFRSIQQIDCNSELRPFRSLTARKIYNQERFVQWFNLKTGYILKFLTQLNTQAYIHWVQTYTQERNLTSQR